MNRRTRSKEEDLARSQVRSFCDRLGTKIQKVRDETTQQQYVQVFPCDTWVEGLTTVFNGWQDVLDRLTTAASRPEEVIDGVLVIGDEEFYEVSEAAE